MNTTFAPETDPTTGITARPGAAALSSSVGAVRDALAHMDDDAVLSVTVGTPHENFDVVEWCAANRTPVINRFDPWPLETLMVQNVPSADSDGQVDRDSDDHAPATTSDDDRAPVRRGFRSFLRNARTGDRTLDRALHAANLADARARMTPGMF
jgi:hypothetical protein